MDWQIPLFEGQLVYLASINPEKDAGFESCWNHGEVWIAIGLGERGYWGKGYGTDAKRILSRHAFDDLNLRHLSSSVFDYNQRALRLYEKIGFIEEDCARQFLNRDGYGYDMIFMGILREEWERR